ncbi:MAG: CusA/CzcA family heavy metal efflux RND transporter, partial [Deltaproteobacteria bacterium]|nr:CusA/CzcA family heavy metal efflux RND transporter [Deltaproteobacteria bacterium]
MFEQIIKLSVRHRWLTLLITLFIAALGAYNYSRLPIDAVPDITNVQVQVNTEAHGYTPIEVEQRITFPLETAIAGLPRLDYTRSISRYGLSQITVVFEDNTDIYFARQLINERLQEAAPRLPPQITPSLGPITTGLGEIFIYIVQNAEGSDRHSPLELRTIQDWIVKPQVRTLPGVAEVNSLGGYEKQFHVTPWPERLKAFDLTFDDIVEALLASNANIGAGYIERNGEQYLVRSPGQFESIEDLTQVVVSTHHNVPVYLTDVAHVYIGNELRTGAATKDGKEVVMGTVFMLMGENSRVVSALAGDRITEINRSLPKGAVAVPVYDRTNLVNATIKTVKENLFEGAILVITVLFLFLGNFKAALITALVIPLSMLFAVTGMVQSKITGNLMSLGAIDFGLIVDGAVIIVENCIRRLGEEQRKLGRLLTSSERFRVVFDASKEVRQATMFGELIIMIVYLPILALGGIEGKLFHPMAYTVILALLGAMIFSVTFVPAAVALFVKGKVAEKEGRILSRLIESYQKLLSKALIFPKRVVAGAVSVVIATAALATALGSE